MSDIKLKFSIAQLNFLVGDIEGNCEKILKKIEDAKTQQCADCVVFTELALIGYPPEDLLLRPNIILRVEAAIERIRVASTGVTVIVGAPCSEADMQFNAAVIIQNEKLIAKYFKMSLPNYNVFDEKRYFSSGNQACVVDIKGVSVGVTICEDIWNAEPIALCKAAGAEVIVNINASPYHVNKQWEREQEVAMRIKETKLPIVYVNQVGGQDELVFDGGSFAMNESADVILRASICKEEVLEISIDENVNLISQQPLSTNINNAESVYKVLTYGLQEYVNKNRFRGGLIGLSGGIDSALALTLAVDALSAERVHAVMMPSKYTSKMSLDDAQLLADNLGVKYSVIEIDSLVNSFSNSLNELFAKSKSDTTEENIQARIRGVLLMAISNKFGNMVISTGNKSEMAVGYATLYGDMAGGFAPLKDVPKIQVFELAKFRNTVSDVIPHRIISRPPSAELAPGQIDEDSLPPYEILDQILELFIEQDVSRNEIIAKGFDEETVSRIIKLVFQNEYKRRQAPPGIKITKRAFGKDRRYPITSGVLNYLND